MASVIAGVGLGLELGSENLLGGAGQLGTAGVGQAENDVYVNAANGNLVIQATDQILDGVGLDAIVARTYNSLGQLNSSGTAVAENNGAGWSDGLSRFVTGLTGTVNSGGSTIEHIAADGSVVTYAYQSSTSAYVGFEGDGSLDTLSFNSGAQTWTWTQEGVKELTDVYNWNSSTGSGQLTSSTDAVGEGLSYSYVSGRLSSVTTADGESLSFNYFTSGTSSGLISSVTTNLSGGTSAANVTYGYDAYGRLTTEATVVSGATNYVTTYGYTGTSSTGLLSSISESDGSDETFIYSGGKVTSVTDYLASGATNVETFGYGTGSTTVSDGGAVIGLGYTTSGQIGELTSLTTPLGATTSYSYDSIGDLLSVSGPIGDFTSFTYGATGALSEVIDSLNDGFVYVTANHDETAADALNNGVRYQSPQDVYAYNANNTLAYDVSPNGEITEYLYNSSNQVSASIQFATSAGGAPLGGQVNDDILTNSTNNVLNLLLLGGAPTSIAVSGSSAGTVATTDGSLTISGATVTYTPNSGFSGTDSFTFTASNALGSTTLCTASLVVGALADATTWSSPRLTLTNLNTWTGTLSSSGSAYTTAKWTTYTYDNRGNLATETTYSTGPTLSGSGGWTGGTIASVEDYAYSSSGELLSARTSGSSFNASEVDVYDGLGRLTSSTDANGALTTYAYSNTSTGLHTVETDANGTITTDSYNLAGELVSMVVSGAHVSATTSYTYNSLGELSKETDADGVNSYFLYDADGRKSADIDALGDITANTYNASDEVIETDAYATALTTSQVSSLSSAAAYGSAVSITLPTVSSGADQVSYAIYDIAGRQIQTIDGAGAVTSDTYNSYSELVSQTTYFNLLATSTTSGWETAPPTSAVSVTSTSADRTTTFAYDADGHRISETVDPGSLALTTSTTYDAFGDVVAVTAANGGVSRSVYDDAGRLIYAVDPDGYVTQVVARDAEGHVLATSAYATPISTSGMALAVTASAISSLVSSGWADVYNRNVYDADGRLAYTIDPEGDITQETYDALGERDAETHYATPLTISQSLILGNAPTTSAVAADISATSADSTTRYGYDGAGRLVYTVDALGAVTQTTYDADGHAVAATAYATPLASSATSALTLSAMAGMTQSALYNTISSGTSSTSGKDDISLDIYNGDGELAYSINAGGYVVADTYNAQGELADVYAYGSNFSSGTLTSLGLTPTAASVSSLLSGGTNDTLDRSVYDADGRLLYNIDPDGAVSLATYNAFGEVAAETDYDLELSFGQEIFLPNPVTSATLSADVAADDTTPSLDRVTRTVRDNAGRVIYGIDPNGDVSAVLDYNGVGEAEATYAYASAISTTSLGLDLTASAFSSHLPSSSGADHLDRSVYDAAGKLIYSINALGQVTSNAYVFGEVVSSTAYANPLTSSASSSLGNVVMSSALASAIISPSSGDATREVYLNNGALAFVIDAAGDVSEDVYDAFGRVTSTRAFSALYSSAGAASYVGMASWSSSSASNTDELTTYVYNGGGEVISKSVELTNPSSGSATFAVTSSVYDTFGNLVELIDPNLHSGFFYYNTLNQQTLAIDAGGYATSTTYDLGGRVDEVIRYTSATSGASVSTPPTISTSATGDITRMAYDADGRLMYTINGDGYVTQNNYDGLGNLASTRVFVSGFTGSGVQTNIGIASWASSSGSTSDDITLYAYDDDGNRKFQIDAVGDVTGYSYDAFGNLSQEHQYATVLTTGSGSQLSGLGADSPLTPAEVTSVVSSSTGDKLTNYTYDQLDEVTSQASTVYLSASSGTAVTTSATESKVYDSFGNTLETVDADGNKTFYYYDADNRKVEEVNGAGDVSHWAYNAFSDETAAVVYGATVTLPTSAGGTAPTVSSGTAYRETDTAYDLANRALTTTISATSTGSIINGAYSGSAYTTTSGNIVTSAVYDADGNTIETIDGDGYTTYYYYDKLGRKVGEATPSFSSSGALEYFVTTYGLDQEGNVLVETQYATPITSATTTLPTVSSSTTDRITDFTYDADGHRLTESRLSATYWTVSSTGALTTSSAQSGTSTVTYAYNFLGEVLSQAEATGDTTSYTYDTAGRQTKVTDASYTDAGGGTDVPTTIYNYNGLDNLTSVVAGNSGSTLRTTSYAYGAGGVLTSSTDANGFVQSYSYDANGNVVGDSYARQTSISGSSFIEEVFTSYDGLGRVTSTQTADFISGAWVGDISDFEYDAFGEVIGKGANLTSSQIASGLFQVSNTYDGAGRLISTDAENGSTIDFVYDADGNQTLEIAAADNDGYSSAASLSGLSLTSAIGLVTTTSGVIGWNDAAGAAATISEYDPAGEVVSTIAPGRQLSVSSGTVSTTSLTTSNGYDAFGDMITETNILGATTSNTFNALGLETQSEIVASSANWTDTSGTVHSGATAVMSSYYDLSGRLIGARDANGNLTTYALLAGTGYAGAKALQTAVYHPDGGEIQYGYDVFGDQTTITTKVTSSYNAVDTLTYDGDGRLLTETYPADTADSDAALTDFYAYDGLGQRIAETNTVLDTSLIISGTSSSHLAVSGYSSAELLSATGGTTSAPDKETTDYDAQGRVTSTVDYLGNKTSYAYAWSSGLITTGMTTSATAFGGWVETITEPGAPSSEIEEKDFFGRMVSQTDFGSSTDTYSYIYDNAGAITSQTNYLSQHVKTLYFNTGETYEVLDNGASVQSLGSSTSATATTTYGYDKAGDITSETYTIPNHLGSQVTYENETATYDQLGRVSLISDTGADAGTLPISNTYEYDLNGNVMNMESWLTEVTAAGVASGGAEGALQDFWYSYDAMNRVIVSEGERTSGSSGWVIERGYGGMNLAYDYAGDRISESTTNPKTFKGPSGTSLTSDNVHTEYYSYTSNGYLKSVSDYSTLFSYGSGEGASALATISGTPTISGGYNYDAMGRETYEMTSQSVETSPIGYSTTSSTYDADSNLLSTVVTTTDSAVSAQVVDTTYDYNLAVSGGGFTGAYMDGQIVAESTSGTTSRGTAPNPTATAYDFIWRTQALQSEINYIPNTSGLGTSGFSGILARIGYDIEFGISGWTTSETYDDNSFLISAVITDGASNNVTYTNNAHGEVLVRSDIGSSVSSYLDDYFLGSQQIGDVANGMQPGSQVDYAQAVGGQYTGVSVGLSVDFDQDYTPVSLSNPAGDPSSYTVQTGDTFYSIAQNVWGDSNLWYLIADANGMSASQTLLAGAVLTIPNGVVTIGNSTTASKPYSANDATGYIQPTAPRPPSNDNGCGGLGAIIVAVVAAAVLVIATGGAAGAALGGLNSALGGAISSVVGNIASPLIGSNLGWALADAVADVGSDFLTDALVGAVGDAAGQGVAILVGAQSQFSWSQVVMSAIGAGVSGVLAGDGPLATNPLSPNNIPLIAARAAIGSGITQGVELATRMESKFDWTSVLTSSVEAGVMDFIDPTPPATQNPDGSFTPGIRAPNTGTAFEGAMAGSAAALIAGASVRSLVTGKDFGQSLIEEIPNTIAATIGQTVGNLIAGGIQKVELDQKIQSAIQAANDRRFDGMSTAAIKQTLINDAALNTENPAAFLAEVANNGDLQQTYTDTARLYNGIRNSGIVYNGDISAFLNTSVSTVSPYDSSNPEVVVEGRSTIGSLAEQALYHAGIWLNDPNNATGVQLVSAGLSVLRASPVGAIGEYALNKAIGSVASATGADKVIGTLATYVGDASDTFLYRGNFKEIGNYGDDSDYHIGNQTAAGDVLTAIATVTGVALGGLGVAKGAAWYNGASLAAKSGVARAGIYEFTTKSGKIYVGQSGNIPSRLGQHIASGKLDASELDNVQTTEVLGGKTAREVAEQTRINELGGIGGLANIVNPIGRSRAHLVPNDPRWSP